MHVTIRMWKEQGAGRQNGFAPSMSSFVFLAAKVDVGCLGRDVEHVCLAMTGVTAPRPGLGGPASRSQTAIERHCSRRRRDTTIRRRELHYGH